MKKKYEWKPFITETASKKTKSKWFSSTIEPHKRRNSNRYDVIQGVKLLVKPQTRLIDAEHGEEAVYLPYYTLLTYQPFLLKIEYNDGSESFRIVFADNPARAIQLVMGPLSDSTINVKVIDAVVQCVLDKDPKVLTDDIRTNEIDKFYDLEK